jgi:hypothetical protein
MDWRPSPEGVRDNLYSDAIWWGIGLLGAAMLAVWVCLREMVSPPILVALLIGFYGVVLLAINQTRDIFRKRAVDPLLKKLDEIEQRVGKLEEPKEPDVSPRPDEIIHPPTDGVLWKWDAEKGADGPFCPRHRARLFHKSWLDQVKTENFEEGHLDSYFWFTCPTDQENFKFPEIRTTQVKTMRAQAAARLRDK